MKDEYRRALALSTGYGRKVGSGAARWLLFTAICVVAAMVVAGIFSSETRAADLVVRSSADSGPNTLRALVEQANTNGQPDTIVFNLPEGQRTITLKSRIELSGGRIVIDGGDQITVSGNDRTKLFVLTGGNTTFEDITLTKGYAPPRIFGSSSGGAIEVEKKATARVESSRISDNRAKYGGGIMNYGTLTVDTSTISSNLAINDGGGIYNTGTMTMDSSTVSGNRADFGGGVFSSSTGFFQGADSATSASIRNSTIAGNSASDRGSGVYSSFSDTRITYSTIANNRSGSANAFGVHDLSNFLTSTRLTGNIIAGNIGGTEPRDVLASAYGNPFESGGSNVIGAGATYSFKAPGDRTGQTPLRAFGTATPILADNGGPTQTIAIGPRSVAVDNVSRNAKDVPSTDQRGASRPQGEASDSGAFEFDGKTPTITLSPGELPDAFKGRFYSQRLSASGSNGSYTFALARGTLPDGLSLSDDGRISGTPTDFSSTRTFTVKAEDGWGFTGEREYTLTVIEGVPAISNIRDQRILENTATGSLRFKVTDPNDPASELKVSVASSNTALVG